MTQPSGLSTARQAQHSAVLVSTDASKASAATHEGEKNPTLTDRIPPRLEPSPTHDGKRSQTAAWEARGL